MKKFFFNFKRLFVLILNSKILFKRPKRKKFLIIDGRNKKLLFRYLKKEDCNILYTRGEFFNLYIALKCLLNFNYLNIHLDYINEYIKSCDPKVCITLNHPKIYFYKLKKFHKNLITIAFQNGHTHLSKRDKFFKELNKEYKSGLKADYIFVQNNFFLNKLFKKYIQSKYISFGSFKNNYYFKKKKNKSQKKIIFISQFRMPENLKKIGYEYKQFYCTEYKILPKLYKFAKMNNYSFEILGSEWSYQTEKNFYSKILVNKKWKFHRRTEKNLSYFKTDKADISVFVNSNLGFESLARGNKTISFNFKSQINQMYYNFGFDFLNKSGKFWTNEDSDKEFLRLMNYSKKVSIKRWNKDNMSLIKKIMQNDPNNKKFQNILSKI